MIFMQTFIYIIYYQNHRTVMEKPLLETTSDQYIDIGRQKLEYRYQTTCLDKLTFGWIHPLMQCAAKGALSQDVLEDLSVEEQSQSIYYKWNDYWKEQKKTNTKDPLLQSIKDTFKKDYIIGTVFDFLAYQFSIITPLLIYFAAHYLLNKRQIGWSVFYLLLIPLVRLLRSFSDAHGTFQLSLLGTEISNSVSIGMVNKAMRFSVLCNKQFKMGEIANLMQVDCFRLSLLPKNLNTVIFVSYCLLFSMVFMGIIVGFAFMAGFAVILVVSILNMVISRFTAQYQKEFTQATDERMKTTSQVFNNIKFIKVNAWEECFYDKLMIRRAKEVGWLRKKFVAQSLSTFSMWLAPKFILAATYGVYVATGGQLDPQKTFSIMSLFGYIQFYLQFLPNSISVVLQSFNALKRIQKFLLSEQIDTSCITYDRFDLPTRQYKVNAIQMKNGFFYWDKDFQEEEVRDDRSREGSLLSQESDRKGSLDLIDLNFNIKKGEIVAIIGGIGSGKSSLLYSLLGEMKFQNKPKVTINGTISLVTQKPWIINDTVKNNIVFGQRFDASRYREALKYACLDRDLELFTHGDQTMIGEKGATLSGGQKARVALARALYSNSDILLLDDLLSAVDVHVGKFLMTQTLLHYLKSKTRVLVTHALYYLKYVDKIFFLEEGKIVEQGSYQLIKNGDRFKQMYHNMMKNERTRRSLKLVPLQQSEKEIIEEISVDEENQLIQEEIIREASIHSKKTKTQSAIDFGKLEALRGKKSRAADVKSKKDGKIEGQEKSSGQNELMLAEEMNSGSSILKLYRSYAQYNLGYGFFALIVLVQVLWMSSNAFSNIWLILWTDYSDGASDSYTMNFYVGIYVLIGFLYALFALIRALLIAYSGPKMSSFIHESIISNLLFSPLNDFFDRVPLGRIFNILSKDLNAVDMNVSIYFNSVLVFSFLFGSNLVVISFLAPIYIFWPIIIVYIIICHFLRQYYSKPAKQLTKLEGITKSPIVSCFSQILQGVSTIRCFKKENMFMISNSLKIDENKKPIMARKAVEVWFTFRLMLCSLLINFTALIYLFFFRDPSPEHASEAALFMVVTLGFDEIMYLLFSNLGTFESELISIERCQHFMKLEPEKGYLQYLNNREDLKYRSRERRKMKVEGWPDKGRIDFIDFKCKYRKNLEYVLKGLNVTFFGGQKIGVVGRTGSGKSTLMMSLLRILEATEGKIVIDGKDIAQLSLDDLRSKITIILQDPCLFAGTIRENLDPLEEYSDDQLNQALQKCSLKEIFDSRQQLQTIISENGQNLSAGQRQLVSIARAILKPAKIVLMDEATANIDVTTQSCISKAMSVSFRQSTVITVAHRLNTVISSDKILVLQGGVMAEYANPQELLTNQNSLFFHLYQQSLKENKI